MNILITGVAGLIGSRMADYIIENFKDVTVVGIDSMFGGYEDNVNPEVKFYKMDLALSAKEQKRKYGQENQLKEIFAKYKFDYVFHFAAYAAEGLSPFIRHFNYSNNVLSTVNIINECINNGVKRLVYTSSMSVYGRGVKPGERFDENDQLAPIDPYAISKYACEQDIKVAGEQHGLDWCIVRPHNVFGIKQNIWDKYRNVLGIWMNNALHNQPMLIYGDGEQTRAFTFIDNILPCLWKCATDEKMSHETVNLGGLVPISIGDACELVAKITGYDNIEHREARHEVKHAVPSYEKSVKLLDYKDTISFEAGLEKMWEWAKTQPDRGQYKWPEYEIEKGIYSYWK